ncbi:MAG: hypothetical protein ACQKHC_02340 [Candidatus Phytoplasma pruni]|uniref:hypothetical protein n=1 Tax=Milkweed yellows phytoplasma TaxID=208434 RepID=UPI00037F30F4|nr:hypothetical protein [Milkweed yellows phytoplasma]
MALINNKLLFGANNNLKNVIPIRQELLNNKEIAERELGIAKKLKQLIQNQKEDHSEFDGFIDNLENQQNSQTIISKWAACEKQYQTAKTEADITEHEKEEDKEEKPSFDDLLTSFNNVNEEFKKIITRLKKYNTKLTKQRVEEKQKSVQEWLSLVDLSAGDNEVLIALKKEITDQIQNDESDNSALSLMKKGNDLFESYEIEDKNPSMNNKLDRAKIYFEDALQKYNQIKEKLKSFIDYTLEKPQEKNAQLERLEKNQQALEKWKNILLILIIFHLIIFALYIIYLSFKTKEKKTFFPEKQEPSLNIEK